MASRAVSVFARHAYKYRPDEPFLLSSGQQSHEYLDCSLALSEPAVLLHVIQGLEPIVGKNVQAVGGPTMGADPIAIGLSLGSLYRERPIRWFSVRKQLKAHEGKLIEGYAYTGDAVCIVDDVITTGSSLLKTVLACKMAGLKVVQVLAVVDRQVDGIEMLKEALPEVPSIRALFTMDEIRSVSGR